MIFRETPNFTRLVTTLLTDENYAKLQASLVANPDRGKLIKGSGGLRKLRWALPGRGKSGGVRVIYYFWVTPEVITFLDLYAKNEKENLTKQEIEALRRQLEG